MSSVLSVSVKYDIPRQRRIDVSSPTGSCSIFTIPEPASPSGYTPIRTSRWRKARVRHASVPKILRPRQSDGDDRARTAEHIFSQRVGCRAVSSRAHATPRSDDVDGRRRTRVSRTPTCISKPRCGPSPVCMRDARVTCNANGNFP